MARQALESNVVGRVAAKRPRLEHCWHLKDEQGEIVACWLDSDHCVKVAVRGSDGSIANMGLALINLDT